MNIKKILLDVFTKTLTFKMKDCCFEMLWNHVFLMGLMLQQDISKFVKLNFILHCSICWLKA